MYKTVLICLLLAGQLQLSAQSPAVRYFDAERFDGSVVVRWTIWSGFKCSNVEVHHGLDSTNFNIVHIEFGICGSDTADQSYSHIHSNAISAESEYYRIKVGFNEFSEVFKLENPQAIPFVVSSSDEQIRFNYINPLSSPYRLIIYDLQGKTVFDRAELKAEEQFVEREKFEVGLYVARIEQEGKAPISKKFILSL